MVNLTEILSRHTNKEQGYVWLKYLSLIMNSTLRAESPSIFLDKSGRGRRLCERLQDFLLSVLERKCNRASINLLVKVCYHRFP